MNKNESPPKPAANDDENRKLIEQLKQKKGDALTDRCTKLTNDLKAKTTAMKTIEKENNNAKDTLRKLQIDLNAKNNTIASLEAQNIKLNDFNNKMYELCKKGGLFEKLETINVDEIESQKKSLPTFQST